MRTPTFVPYAGVTCRQHGDIDINYDDYMRQMRDPNARWKCPICKMTAEFNDSRFEELNPEPEE